MAAPRRSLGVGAALALIRDNEGRAQLVEVQCVILPPTATSAAGAGAQRRITCSGCSAERVRIVAAIVDRELTIPPGDLVVRTYGPTVADAGQLDAAIAGALVSAAQGRPLPSDIMLAGEVSLDGVVRPVGFDVEGEAAKLGLRAIRPGASVVSWLSRAHLSVAT